MVDQDSQLLELYYPIINANMHTSLARSIYFLVQNHTQVICIEKQEQLLACNPDFGAVARKETSSSALSRRFLSTSARQWHRRNVSRVSNRFTINYCSTRCNPERKNTTILARTQHNFIMHNSTY